ncbi:MAG: heme o synthase [Candidatus Saccharibacteria bacterium]|nr:heme o synthase [Candidatus Saccharibacteria bacterium]
MSLFKDYYQLLKPGIVRGNLITAVAGYLLASKGNVDVSRLLPVLAGFYLTLGSSCVLNNVIDIDIDSKMHRTKDRALVKGTITVKQALIYSAALMIIGTALLYFYGSVAAIIAGFIGWIFYIVIYSKFTKRQTVLGTLAGSVSGAMPPVAGYLAVGSSLDIGVILIFLSLVFWQMPHFFAIAIMQQKDYSEAGIQVMSVVYGIAKTRQLAVSYILGFGLVMTSLYLYGYCGIIFLITMLILTTLWLIYALKPVNTKNQLKWGLKVFRTSLLVLLMWSLLLSIENYLN